MIFNKLKNKYLTLPFDEATHLDLVNQMLSLGEKTKDNSILGRAYFYFAHYYYTMGKIDDTINFSNKSIHFLNSYDNYSELVKCYNLLGNSYSIKGNISTAIDYYIIGIETSDKITCYSDVSLIYNNLASIQMSVGAFTSSIINLLKAKKIALEDEQNKSDEYSNLFYIYTNLCYCYNALHDLPNLQVTYDCLLEVFPLLLKTSKEEAQFYNVTSLVLCHKNKIDEIKECFKNLIFHLKIANSMDFEDIFAAVPYWLKHGYDKEAKDVLYTCKEKIDADNLGNYLISYYHCMIILNKQQNNITDINNYALEYYKAAISNEEMNQKITSESINNRLILYEVNKKYIQAKYEALTDALTGLNNRLALENILNKKFSACQIKNEEIGLAFIDIDYFKYFNDTYGHLAGDSCIISIANEIKSMLDNSTYAIRYGGDEFIILFCNQSKQAVEHRTKKLLNDVTNLKIPHEKSTAGIVTISLGVFHGVPYCDDDIFTFMRKADRELYKIKGNHF